MSWAELGGRQSARGRFVRFAAVSAALIPLGYGMWALLVHAADAVPRWMATLVVALCTSPIGYWASQRWIWVEAGRDGHVKTWSQFTMSALASAGLAAGAVALGTSAIDQSGSWIAADLTAGALAVAGSLTAGVLRFLALDSWLWRAKRSV